MLPAAGAPSALRPRGISWSKSQPTPSNVPTPVAHQILAGLGVRAAARGHVDVGVKTPDQVRELMSLGVPGLEIPRDHHTRCRDPP